jgi:hypothetical protein
VNSELTGFGCDGSLSRLIFSLGLMFPVMRGTLNMCNSHFLTTG